MSEPRDGLLGHLDYWTNGGLIDENDPEQPEPTAEDALRFLVFCMITDYVQEHDAALAEWMASNEPELPDLDEWVDQYATRAPTEEGGYFRHPNQ